MASQLQYDGATGRLTYRSSDGALLLASSLIMTFSGISGLAANTCYAMDGNSFRWDGSLEDFNRAYTAGVNGVIANRAVFGPYGMIQYAFTVPVPQGQPILYLDASCGNRWGPATQATTSAFLRLTFGTINGIKYMNLDTAYTPWDYYGYYVRGPQVSGPTPILIAPYYWVNLRAVSSFYDPIALDTPVLGLHYPWTGGMLTVSCG